MRLLTAWPDLRARDPNSLRWAKMALISRFGEAMRCVVRRRTLRPAYLELFRIACLEPSYAVRVAIAQEIGAGEDHAFEALQHCLRGPRIVRDRRPDRENDEDLSLELWGGQQPEVVSEQQTRRQRQTEGEAARTKRELRERQKQRTAEYDREREEREAEEQRWRDNTMCAWLVPLLVGSVTTRRHHDTPYGFLEGWVERVGAPRLASTSVDGHGTCSSAAVFGSLASRCCMP